MPPMTPFRILGQRWAKLEPAQNPEQARTTHGKLPPNIVYPAGQLLFPATDGSGVWAKPGETGYTLSTVTKGRLLLYPYATDANGLGTMGSVVIPAERQDQSMEMYHQGDFYVHDITGLTDALLAQSGSLVQGAARTDTNAILRLG